MWQAGNTGCDMGLAVIPAEPRVQPLGLECGCLETTPGSSGSLTSSYTLVEDSIYVDLSLKVGQGKIPATLCSRSSCNREGGQGQLGPGFCHSLARNGPCPSALFPVPLP